MRVLGVDPGTFKMGVGVVEYLKSEYHVVHFGVLNAPKSKSLPQRLHILFDQLSDIVDIWKPTELAAAIKYILNHPDEAFNKGKAARERCQRMYDIKILETGLREIVDLVT